MSELHLMIDLETLSTSPNAVVTQLGWAVFDPNETTTLSSGCVHLIVHDQIKQGRHTDWKTIQWWLMQDEQARKLLATTPNWSVGRCLDEFEQSVSFDRIVGVWSHGAAFDIPILESLYDTINREVPWSFRNVRDTRTLFWLAGKNLSWAKNDIKHSAEHDAIAQALTVQNAMRLLRSPDTSDIPEAGEEFFRNATFIEPKKEG